jgi:hypothetical protein
VTSLKAKFLFLQHEEPQPEKVINTRGRGEAAPSILDLVIKTKSDCE